jgi:hypothetical protein
VSLIDKRILFSLSSISIPKLSEVSLIFRWRLFISCWTCSFDIHCTATYVWTFFQLLMCVSIINFQFFIFITEYVFHINTILFVLSEKLYT